MSEDNERDLSDQSAVDKIKEIVGKAKTCFFVTDAREPGSTGARPMAVQKVDDDGHLWFLSADDSHKNLELAKDPSVTLYFQGSPHSDFLLLHGTASVTRSRERIKELWNAAAKNWFPGGVDDPRVTAIRVSPTGGHYWDAPGGGAVAGVKMLIGALVGKTVDVGREGTIRP
jgi:general stress protein 26